MSHSDCSCTRNLLHARSRKGSRRSNEFRGIDTFSTSIRYKTSNDALMWWTVVRFLRRDGHATIFSRISGEIRTMTKSQAKSFVAEDSNSRIRTVSLR